MSNLVGDVSLICFVRYYCIESLALDLNESYARGDISPEFEDYHSTALFHSLLGLHLHLNLLRCRR